MFYDQQNNNLKRIIYSFGDWPSHNPDLNFLETLWRILRERFMRKETVLPMK